MSEINIKQKTVESVASEVNELSVIEPSPEQPIDNPSVISEIDIDEFVIRSIRKIDNIVNKDGQLDSQEIYTVNSKILPTLAETFQPIIEPDVEMPNFISLTPEQAVGCLGEMTGISDHETNFISFWTLDTLAGCLRKVQSKNMELCNQKVLIAWFGFFLKTLSVHGWDRENTFSDFKNLILSATEVIKNGSVEIPLPKQCLELIQKQPSSTSFKSNETFRQSESSLKSVSSKKRGSSNTSKVEKQNSKRSSSIQKRTSKKIFSKNLQDLEMLAECIYDIFANRFKYEVIKLAFTSTTNVTTVILPHILHVPKCMEPQEDVKKTKNKKKKDTKPIPLKDEKVEDIQTNQYIIPLSKAIEIDEKFFLQLFPQQLKASFKKSPKSKGKKGSKK